MYQYSLKKDYYDQLRQNYYEEGENSFIFCYLEQNPRSDTCFRVILRQRWKELKAGKISRLDYVEYIVDKLSKTPKLYQEGSDYKLILPLLYYGLGLSEEEADILERTSRKKDVQEKLRFLESQMKVSEGGVQEKLSKIPLETLEDMTRRLEFVSLQVEVRNFFYEIGLPITDTSKFRKEGTAKRKPERKKDPSLNMLDAYCAQNHLFLSAAGAGTRRDSEEDYDAFFRKIAKSGKSDILIPIIIDSQTGCALFIVGKKFIDDFRYVIHLKANREYIDYCCAYGILGLDTDDSEAVVSDGYRHLLSYHALKYRFRYREAWEIYETIRRENLKRIQNYNRFPEGTEHPESLNLYFMRGGEREKMQIERGTDEKFSEFMSEVEPRENLGRTKRL